MWWGSNTCTGCPSGVSVWEKSPLRSAWVGMSAVWLVTLRLRTHLITELELRAIFNQAGNADGSADGQRTGHAVVSGPPRILTGQ